ncbi:hypothetical protein ACROYT_G020607 [Oculina patagonica]
MASRIGYYDSQMLHRDCENAVHRDLQHAARLYDKAELAGREYARKARNCAEENILVAKGVLQGKQYYTPQDVLDAFEDMVDGLLKEYDLVITKHNVVVDLMAAAQTFQTKLEGQKYELRKKSKKRRMV